MARAPAKVLRVSLLSRSTRFIVGPALLSCALVPLSLVFWRPGQSALPWALFGPCVGLLMAWLARQALTHLEVGRDGVLLRRRGKRRFLPFFRMESLEDRGADLRFVLVDGEEVVVRTARERPVGKERHLVPREVLVRSVREGIARRRDRVGEEGADARMLLAHAQRALGREVDEPVSYRTEVLPRAEELWRVVDDPDADETARAAAAVALRREPEAKARLRVRAEETASPPLRKLLRVAAEDEPERTVARALDACVRRDPR